MGECRRQEGGLLTLLGFHLVPELIEFLWGAFPQGAALGGGGLLCVAEAIAESTEGSTQRRRPVFCGAFDPAYYTDSMGRAALRHCAPSLF